jgi:DedD protein
MEKNPKKDRRDGEKKSPMSSARKAYALWSLLAVFVSAWMFMLGVIVGRGTSPVHFDIEKLKNELAELKRTVQKDTIRFKIESDTLDNVRDLEFYEKLKEPDVKTRHDRQPIKETAIRGNAATPAQSPPVLSKPTVPDESNFTIQIAAYKEPKLADDMVERLKNRGYQAYRSQIQTLDQNTWYRVRVGFFKSRQDAQSTLARLKEEGLGEAIVMSYR